MAVGKTSISNNSASSINIKVRIKNPWFWIGIFGVMMTTLNISPETVSTWPELIDAFIIAVQNPYTVASAIIAILGVIIDPTTAGVGDSTRALSYTRPKR